MPHVGKIDPNGTICTVKMMSALALKVYAARLTATAGATKIGESVCNNDYYLEPPQRKLQSHFASSTLHPFHAICGRSYTILLDLERNG